MRRGRQLTALAVTTVVLLGACGGGDSDDTAPTTTAAAPAASTETTAPTTTPETTPATTEAASPSGDSDSSWCDEVRAGAAGEESGLSFDLLGRSAAEIEAQFRRNVEVMREWASRAPGEIADDVETMAGAFQALVDVGEEAEWDLVAIGSDPDFESTFATPEIEAAADRIDQYSRDVCGVDLGLDVDAPGDSVTLDTTPPAGDPEDLVDAVLRAFGLSADILPEAARSCANERLAEAFPDGLPEPLQIDEALFEVFDDISVACGF